MTADLSSADAEFLDDGLDIDWALTRGVDAAWRYAFNVASLLVDVEAAYEEGNWLLCVSCCQSALRSMVMCEQLLDGHSGTAADTERHVRIAFHRSQTADALCSLLSAGDEQSDAEYAVGVVRRHDERLRAGFPFVPPFLRAPSGPAQSMRLSASINRLRIKRGLGSADWS
jgi:hypothetical protein